jgi:hypothetical protein
MSLNNGVFVIFIVLALTLYMHYFAVIAGLVGFSLAMFNKIVAILWDSEIVFYL